MILYLYLEMKSLSNYKINRREEIMTFC